MGQSIGKHRCFGCGGIDLAQLRGQKRCHFILDQAKPRCGKHHTVQAAHALCVRAPDHEPAERSLPPPAIHWSRNGMRPAGQKDSGRIEAVVKRNRKSATAVADVVG
jgi:hypothetical protein